MNLNTYKFDANSIIIIAGILLILYFIKLVMNNQDRINKRLSNIEKNLDNQNITKSNLEFDNIALTAQSVNTGSSSGDMKIIGVDDDEVIAVIMAAVSHASSIPISNLKFKSIKRIS